jgi:hypothetical protein
MDESGSGHAVEAVEIDGDEHVAVCSCGWKSPAAATETEAREAQDAHALVAG